MKIVSWNVNGLRAALRNGFSESVRGTGAHIVCVQETRLNESPIDVGLDNYRAFFNNSRTKKGYSGTAVFSLIEPKDASIGMGIDEHDAEGRVITLEFDRFFLVNVYTPNAQHGLVRLDYRMKWDADFLAYLKSLERGKPVIFCGDLNVAHTEIDLANPKANERNPGFTKEEREGFDRIVASGFIDTFREFNKEPGNYTWWTYRFNARAKNIGWRIDYVCISASLRPHLADAFILKDIYGSDHCPVGVVMDLP
ncbi:MAG TPA: exodeoxyribonuclease III [Deltaproteobacteria bacterium]|nr:exodeoxyribonuclease III [Deltaproteobacteria bacterium]